MNIGNLRNFISNVEADDNDSVEMKMIQKIGNGIWSHTPQLTIAMREELKVFYTEILNNNFFDLEQSEYNPNIVIEGSLQVSDLTNAHINEVLAEIDLEENCNDDMGNVDLDKINYYRFKSNYNGNSLYIFRRFTKMKKIRNGILGRFQDNTFRKIETDVFFGIDRDIDILLFDNEALIVNRFALQTIFKLNDYFIERATTALSELEEENVLVNFEDFKNDCLNDKLAARRMTKIINTEGRLEGFLQNTRNLPEVIEHFDLEIELNDNNQIIYNGSKEARSQILFCISDAYYQSLILQRLGEDPS